MLYYIFEVSLCWFFFYLIYQIFLKKETFFVSNRAYLMATILLGIIIPFNKHFGFTFFSGEQLDLYIAPLGNTLENIEITITANAQEQTGWSLLWQIIFYLYCLGASYFACRLFINSRQIYTLYKHAEVKRLSNGSKIAYTNIEHLPFSFWNVLFWSNQIKIKKEEEDKIIQHEIAHINQHHSYDVLFIEIIAVLFWCSPMVYLYKKAIKNNHEYLADACVLENVNKKEYGQLLISHSINGVQMALSNQFFNSQLKNRINMMTKSRSQNWAKLKYIGIIPALLLLAGIFAFQYQGNNSSEENRNSESSTLPLNDSLPTFRVVEEMPRFPGCEDIEDKKERNDCARKNMLEYVYKNIKYPEAARKAGIEGQVVIQFVVEKNGEISEVKTVRDIGGECAQESERVVKSMNEMSAPWIAGKQRGEKQRVLFTLPIRFKLEGESKVISVTDKTPPPPPPPPPAIPDDLFKVVEEMPRFPGCEDIVELTEKKACAQKNMLEYIYKNLVYPTEARDKGIEGLVVLQFIVEKDGSLTGIKTVRSIGGGCDKESMRVIESMNTMDSKWIPGKQRGEKVRVLFTLPVRFKLGEETETAEKTQAVLRETKNDNPLSLKIYPNPTHEELNIQFNGEGKDALIRIYNVQGQSVHEEKMEVESNQVSRTININKLHAGTYYITLKRDNHSITKKFIKPKN